MEEIIINSVSGEKIALKPWEAEAYRRTERDLKQNATGYEIDLTTLTGISKNIVEQKFFTVAPADYMPVKVGENPFTAEILTYRDFSVADDFETGNVNTASNDSRLASADSAVDSIRVPVINWAKQVNYSLFDLQMASKSGNWDLVSSKERSRKKNWDLGIQKIAFVGSSSVSTVKGLLTQDNVTTNTTLITKTISSMTEAEFSTFVQGIVAAYRTNALNTVYPTHFIMPESDYNGLVAPVSATYPNISKLDYLLKAFRVATMNPNFQILPLAYADQANNATVVGLNKNIYTLLNYDQDSINMNIPVNYTNTLANTLNGIQFQNGAYGQYSGCKAYREREMLYFAF